MSTTIYNAVRFQQYLTLDDVAAWIETLKPLVQQQAFDDFLRKMAWRAVGEFDRQTLEGCFWRESQTENHESAISKAHAQWENERRELGNRGRIYDDKGSVRVIPHKGRIYALFSFTDDVLNAVKKNGLGQIFDDYSYWNNTDHDEKFPYEEWKERGKVWDEIFADPWESNNVGMVFTLTKEYVFDYHMHVLMEQVHSGGGPELQALKEKMKEVFPDLKKRAKNLDDCIPEGKWLPQFSSTDNGGIAQAIQYMKAINQDKIPEFVEAYNFLMDNVLDKDITVEKLLMSFEKLKPSYNEIMERIITEDNIPSSLFTPLFEKEYLTRKLPFGSRMKEAKKL